jgi:hypothetical protein
MMKAEVPANRLATNTCVAKKTSQAAFGSPA